MPNLERAIQIAVQAHRGQQDKAGQLYILHPLRVMFRLENDLERTVGVLHDVVEDTSWTSEQLREEGFSEEILMTLDGVTNRDGESYEDFIERSAANPVSKRVKLADLEDNMDVKRMQVVRDRDRDRLNKYLQAWRHLTSA